MNIDELEVTIPNGHFKMRGVELTDEEFLKLIGVATRLAELEAQVHQARLGPS